MNWPDEEIIDFTAVHCPVCRAKFEAPLKDGPGETECPDCLTSVAVPPRQRAVVTRSGPTAGESEDGAYRIATGEREAPQRPPKPEDPGRAMLTCTECGSRITPELREKPYNVSCPDCLDVIEVPSRDDWEKSRPRKPRKKPKPQPEPSTDDPFPEFRPVPPSTEPAVDLEAAFADIRKEVPDAPPKLAFFSHVFNLPWRTDVLANWILQSVGFTLLGLVLATLLWVLNAGVLYAVPFFVLPAIFLTMLTGSYAVSSFMTIVEDTANGNDRIRGWNDLGWKDHAVDACAPLYLAVLACAASYGMAMFAVVLFGPVWFWTAMGMALSLTFPVFLLSSLHAGTVWVPVTMPVLKTLGRHTACWLIFYGLSTFVWAVYGLPVFYALRSGSWFLGLMCTGPLLPAVLLIEARLIGRLAWKTLVLPSTKVSRKTRKQADKSQRRKPANSPPREQELQRIPSRAV